MLIFPGVIRSYGKTLPTISNFQTLFKKIKDAFNSSLKDFINYIHLIYEKTERKI